MYVVEVSHSDRVTPQPIYWYVVFMVRNILPHNRSWRRSLGGGGRKGLPKGIHTVRVVKVHFSQRFKAALALRMRAVQTPSLGTRELKNVDGLMYNLV